MAARRALVGRLRSRQNANVGRFTSSDVDRLLEDSWRRYANEEPTLAAQPTLGSQLNLRLACITSSIFHALLDEGVERSYAVELVADATWKVYAVRGRLLPRLLGSERDLRRKVQPDGTVGLAFPFNPPGYIAKHAPDEPGFAFHMVHCAVAGYLRSQGDVDLCLAAWCNLDYPLAEQQGLRLTRTQTLVEGADYCDFHWFDRKTKHAGTDSEYQLAGEAL